MSRPTLRVLCGIQGSGKSTYAKDLQKVENWKIFSSDEYRKQYPEMNNDQIFSTLYKDLKQSLLNKEHCIFDATNVTIKSRKKIFEVIKNIDCEKEIMVFATPYSLCLKRVSERNKDENSHFVPLEILRKYIMSFEIPFYEEGWDSIGIVHKDARQVTTYALRDMMYYFNQNNIHHKYNLGEHGRRTFEAHGKYEELWKIYAYILHDIGKMFTASIGGDGQAHYYNHANVGSYFLLTCDMREEFELFEKLELLFLVNYHMKPFDWKSEKAINKWKGIFGEKKFNELVYFNRCDRIGSGTENENGF